MLELDGAWFSDESETLGCPLGVLRDALDQRKDRGTPLRELRLMECSRITEDDVNKAGSGASAGAAPASAAAAFQDIPLTNMRRTIAKRLQESTQNNPHFFVSSKISVTKLLKLRQALNSSAEGKYKLSVNDFVLKAVALALADVPEANSAWMGDVIRQYVAPGPPRLNIELTCP